MSDTARLVTLIGPGGIGKTSLAVEAVRRFHKARHRPAYWVPLARLGRDADPMAVAEEVAQAVIEVDFSGRSAWDVLVDKLTGVDAAGRTSRPVLVLDNCEHVLTSVGQLIAELLQAAPRLTVLATSRAAVGWVDEHIMPVPPLSAPQAVTLFRQRAEFAGQPIADAQQIATAEQICRRVDNNPLFIRLAAGRLRYEPPAMILRELTGEAGDKRLQWSHGRNWVGTDERHRGVRNVIAWSYGLCQDRERLLLDRMSVFAAGNESGTDGDETGYGGADLEAVELVCAGRSGDGAALRSAEIERLLERLVDQSLVSVHITEAAVRYYLLDSVRVFAYEQLRQRGPQEPASLATRHARYYRDKVAQAQATWFGPAEQGWLEWARGAWDNIVLAIETSLTVPSEAVVGLEICTGLMSLRVPFVRGAHRAIRRLSERSLEATALTSPQPTELRVAAMAMIGWISLWQAKHEDAERLLEECVAICVSDLDVRQHWRDMAATDIGLPGPVEFTWGMELLLIRRDAAAITVMARARRKFAAAADRGGEERSELFEALASAFLGTADQALGTGRRHYDRVVASGAGWATSWAELALAIGLTKHGDLSEAMTFGRSALARQLAVGDQWTSMWAVHIRIWSLARAMEDARADEAEQEGSVALAVEAAQLVGGAITLRKKMGIVMTGIGLLVPETQKAIDLATAILGSEKYAAAQRRGTLLRPEFQEVQRLALGTLPVEPAQPSQEVRGSTPSNWLKLSLAEREVAILAAAGWTNGAVAARRGNSVRTIDAQMSAILQKLMIPSRADIVDCIPERLVGRVRQEARQQPSRMRHRPPPSDDKTN